MLTKKEVRDMIRLVWVLLAAGSFVGAAVLAAAEQMAPVVIAFAILGCFFIAIAIGGKKGLPFGVGLLVFVACLFGIWQAPRLIGSSYNWMASKRFLDTLADKPGEIVLVYLGLIALIVLLIITPPILVGRKLWRRIVVPTKRVSAVAPPLSRVRKKETDVGEPAAEEVK